MYIYIYITLYNLSWSQIISHHYPAWLPEALLRLHVESPWRNFIGTADLFWIHDTGAILQSGGFSSSCRLSVFTLRYTPVG